MLREGSKMVEEINTDEIKCPFCGNRAGANDDFYDYDCDQFHTIEECGKCGKSYQWLWESKPVFTIKNPECLNDGEHNWIQNNRCYPKKLGWVICRDCGKEEENEELWTKLEEEKKKKSEQNGK